MVQKVRAVILAAGCGERLKSFDDPKCLLRFGGETLLSRNINILRKFGVHSIDIVTGFKSETIAAQIARFSTFDVQQIVVPWLNHGSMYSMVKSNLAYGDWDRTLLLDADVLFPETIVKRILSEPSKDVILADASSADDDEAVKVCLNGDKLVVDFDKNPCNFGVWHGESLGLFSFSMATCVKLDKIAKSAISSFGVNVPHELALRRLFVENPFFKMIDVTGAPWIEIDFDTDVDKANEEIFELIQALDGVCSG